MKSEHSNSSCAHVVVVVVVVVYPPIFPPWPHVSQESWKHGALPAVRHVVQSANTRVTGLREKKRKETRSDVWLREGLKNIFDCGRNTAGTTFAAAAPDRSMLLEAIFTFNRTKCCAEVVSEWKLRIRCFFFFFLPFQIVFRRRESHSSLVSFISWL